jgi:hypothetical protein
MECIRRLAVQFYPLCSKVGRGLEGKGQVLILDIREVNEFTGHRLFPRSLPVGF